ncbi:MAG: fusaric acid resistance protein [Gammaproteobacteria bacterium]|nr:fusaric acid resistance protein [Gammaproteobacteria bacterium]
MEEASKNLQNIFHLRWTFKIALACLLATIAANFFHLSLAFLTVLAPLALMVLYPYQLVAKSLERILGPAIGTLIGAAALALSNNVLLQIMFMIFILMLSGYLFFREIFPYASVLGGVVGVLVINQALISTPHEGIELGINFVIATFVGALIAYIVNRLVWPVKLKQPFFLQLGNLIQTFAKPQSSSLDIADFVALKQLLANCTPELGEDVVNTYYELLLSLRALYFKYRRLAFEFNTLEEASHQLVIATNTFTNLSSALNQTYQQFGKAISCQEPCAINFAALEQLLAQAEQNLTQAYQDCLSKSQATDEVLKLFEIQFLYRGIIESLQQSQQIYTDIVNNKPHLSNHTKKESHPLFPIQFAGIKIGVKLTLTILLMIFINRLFRLSDSTQEIITCMVLIIQPNIGRSDRKSLLRFAGVAVGGIISFIALFILAYAPHFSLLLFLMFAGIFATAYVGLSGERYGYAGFQAGMMLPLILLVELHPPTSLTLAFQRFFGVLLGAVIVSVIQRFLWPVHPWQQLKQVFANELKRVQALFEQKFFPADSEKKALAGKDYADTWTVHTQLLKDVSDEFVSDNTKNLLYTQIANFIYEIYASLIALNAAAFQQNNFISETYPIFMPTYQGIQKQLDNILAYFETDAKLENLTLNLQDIFSQQLKVLQTQKLTYNLPIQALQNYAILISTLKSILAQLNLLARTAEKF